MALGIIFIGTVIFLSHFFFVLFERKKIPDVLPLVFLGLVIGPLFKFVTPAFFGKFGDIFVTVALVIILFQSGLDLKLTIFKESLKSGTRLTLINFLVTFFVVAILACSLFKITFLEGLILGSILGGTSSAVVIPLVRKLPLREQSRTALFLESTFSDVLCIVVTLALLQAFRYHNLNCGMMLGQIIASFSLAAAIGCSAAIFWSTALCKIREIQNGIFLSPAFVFIVYGIAELLGYSGAIAAFAFGLTLGNVQYFRRVVPKKALFISPVEFNEREKAFFGELEFLLKTFFFVYIGISIKVNNQALLFGGLMLTIAVFIIRIPVIYLAMERITARFDISIISAMVPKGLAAAVLAALPLRAGVPNGAIIQDIVYAVILFSIIFTGLLIILIERKMLHSFYALIFSSYSIGNEPAVITVDYKKKEKI
ncbi:MAG: cation:proton antiporter [Candidatus Omnitrophota bacterium]